MKKMEINKEKLNAIAIPLSSSDRERMEVRRNNRYWWSASSAIAAKIRRQLKKAGISQTEFAEKLGVTPANVTRYLSGRTNFELRTLIEIERALGIHIIDRNVVPDEELLPVNENYDLLHNQKRDQIRIELQYNVKLDNYLIKNDKNPQWITFDSSFAD